MVLFDLTEEESYTVIASWLRENQKILKKKGKRIVLVGTKLDIAADLDKRAINFQIANSLASELEIDYFEVSSRYEENTLELLESIVNKELESEFEIAIPEESMQNA